ncbi:GDP-mannose 4,6-dehydratase [Methylophilaceae bacterium]|nr:GDP-mannose 4,6-dehydratase [Methylophilaceae bacterium]
MKTALITGITGQDGAYLAEYLLSMNYSVIGAYRRSSTSSFWRLKELKILEHEDLKLVEHDLTDLSSSIRILEEFAPDEVYNLAAQSFVGVSFSQPITTSKITALGPLNILEAIRLVNKKIKFYQASSSEMFGKVQEIPQNENTIFYPRSPYGVSKLFAHWMTINYRESYDIHASSGILFNHESPLRGIDFVTRKISDSVAKIKLGKIKQFSLGNLDAKRDWGFAKEFVSGMHKILNADEPDSYVLSTGKTTSVRDFLINSFNAVGIEIIFKGVGLELVALDAQSNRTLVTIDEKFYRPTEVDLLIGDSSKAERNLGWKAKTNLEELARIMVEADMIRNK